MTKKKTSKKQNANKHTLRPTSSALEYDRWEIEQLARDVVLPALQGEPGQQPMPEEDFRAHVESNRAEIEHALECGEIAVVVVDRPTTEDGMKVLGYLAWDGVARVFPAGTPGAVAGGTVALYTAKGMVMGPLPTRN